MDSVDKDKLFQIYSKEMDDLTKELVDTRDQMMKLLKEDETALWWLQLRCIFLNGRLKALSANVEPLLKKENDKPADVIVFPGFKGYGSGSKK